MSWTYCVSDIPMKEWVFFRRLHAVAVDHQVYLFDYNKSRDEDTIKVLVFNPRTHVIRVVQPDGRGEESLNEILASKGELVLIHFAAAYKEKVYVCVGGRATASGRELLVFDTRRARWGCVTTSGNVPSSAMRWRVGACEQDGHLYAWSINSTAPASEETYLWALEMSSLRWKIVAFAGWDESYSPRCIVPYKNRVYVLLERLSIPLEYSEDEIMYFDLATKTWERPQPPGAAPLSLQLWIPFFFQDHLYVFLKEKRISDLVLRKIYDNVNFNELVLRYSFADNKWEQVCFRGITPPAPLHLACVVDNVGVFFSLNQKKTYVLDFFPSLRSLCFQAVRKYRLGSIFLPAVLKRELSMYYYSSNDFK
ncbi:hypothetical protein R5R35_007499 [Gryllus longicercus]|uniref:Uncharacterized protein n=1 Tax=Gryllus longicercus TaxID=2509291 RepID=A0AAN9Z9Z0_9ORTH